MLYYTARIGDLEYYLEIQSDIMFAFNRNTISIECHSQGQEQPKFVNLSMDESSIRVYNNKNKVNICIDSLLKSFVGKLKFPQETMGYSQLSIKNENGEKAVFEDGREYIDICVIYGYIRYGQRMADIGTFDGKENAFYRHMTWFSNFETKFSVFARSGFSFENVDVSADWTTSIKENYGYIRNEIDNIVVNSYDDSAVRKLYRIKNKEYRTGPFDEKFTDEFHLVDPRNTYIICERCNKTTGTFLRWVDNRGLWYSYLFDDGKDESETEQSKDTVTRDNIIEGISYAQSYPIKKTTTYKKTCAAVNLDKERFEDVSTILSALYVEMYVGGKFKQVNIIDGTATREAKKVLNEVEVEIEIDKFDIAL